MKGRVLDACKQEGGGRLGCPPYWKHEEEGLLLVAAGVVDGGRETEGYFGLYVPGGRYPPAVVAHFLHAKERKRVKTGLHLCTSGKEEVQGNLWLQLLLAAAAVAHLVQGNAACKGRTNCYCLGKPKGREKWREGSAFLSWLIVPHPSGNEAEIFCYLSFGPSLGGRSFRSLLHLLPPPPKM